MGEFSEKWDGAKPILSKKKYYMHLAWAGGLGGAAVYTIISYFNLFGLC